MHLLDVYLSKLPKDEHRVEAFTFGHCLRHPKKGHGTQQYLLEKNKLTYMVMNMCEDASLRKKTNHYLHLTAATALFEANVPEKLIQEHTGHRHSGNMNDSPPCNIEQHPKFWQQTQGWTTRKLFRLPDLQLYPQPNELLCGARHAQYRVLIWVHH